jgi:RNA polymerase sigma-70 factor (ECF subfamily)
MTTPPTTTDLVLAARSGDVLAYADLVRRFTQTARAFALASLGGEAAAEDAVQDAFVTAWLRLDQLREPAAFPGWLRRCVHKHCDRQRRRQRPTEEIAPGLASNEIGVVDALDAAQVRKRLRAAIEALPEHQRMCVALHHLGGAPVADIARFLEITPSAVKKRLFDARKRLALTPEDPMDPRPTVLAERISLFLAVRTGDQTAVRELLQRRPELLEAEERWSDEEALQGGFTLAHHVTPLILAASYGDLPMVELLLGLGASPEGRCGCANGETAVWAAARAGYDAVVERLQRAGARADQAFGAGMTLEGLRAWRRSPPAAPPMDGLSTGLRALDLWLPLQPHQVVRVHGAAETGLTVLLAELTLAMAAQGWATAWTSWEVHPWHRRELEVLAARYGLPADLRLFVGGEGVLDAALEAVQAEQRPTLHVIFEQEGRAAELEARLHRLAGAATLTLVVFPWAQVTRGERPPPKEGPWDAVLVTDPRLAAQGLYPAVDPLRTRSLRASPDPVRDAARACIESYAALDPTLTRADPASARARRLLAVLTQPFHVATPETGWPGVLVAPEATRYSVQAVLDGACDDVAEASLRYRRTNDPIGPESPSISSASRARTA